jgi:UDP-3-O-acyl-N-acetylglucosamine deacetylase
MEHSLISEYARTFSPAEIRPGTICSVEITRSVNEVFTWDSSSQFVLEIEGFLTKEAVKTSVDISTDTVTVTYTATGSAIAIAPANEGTVTVTVDYYVKDIVTRVARSAFSSTDTTYYKDFIIEHDIVIPKTVVELPETEGITAVKITPTTTNNGIDYWDNLKFELSSQGTLTCTSLNYAVNVLRKGKETVSVPDDFEGPYLKREYGRKLVVIDNQEWKTGYYEARGLAFYHNTVYITTNYSLSGFDIKGTFIDTAFEDSGIQGWDLTFYSPDHLLIVCSDGIRKYRVRHDLVLINSEEKCIYTREKDPRIDITV